MEQVKTLSREIDAIEAPRLSSCSPGCHITCALIWLSFTSPEVSSAVMFHLSATAIGIVLCHYGGVATHRLVPTVCMDEPGQQINAKRHVNHHPLTPSITPPGCWPSITHFIFLLPPARIPTGAARLPGRKVTTRGRPNVTTRTEEASFSCCRIHSFISAIN